MAEGQELLHQKWQWVAQPKQSELEMLLSGAISYGSDCCYWCDCYSGYGQIWCGVCEAGKSSLEEYSRGKKKRKRRCTQ